MIYADNAETTRMSKTAIMIKTILNTSILCSPIVLPAVIVRAIHAGYKHFFAKEGTCNE